MKRRNFLKGMIGGAAAAFVAPAAAKADFDGIKLTSAAHPRYSDIVIDKAGRPKKSIAIEHFLNNPHILEAERYHLNKGHMPADWRKYIERSDFAYELYGPDGTRIAHTDDFHPGTHREINISYGVMNISGDDDNLIRFLSTTIISLRIRAENAKLEGHAVGSGRVIIQSRMNVEISDSDDVLGARDIYWRGAIARIPLSTARPITR